MADLCSPQASVRHTLSSHAKGAQQFSCCFGQERPECFLWELHSPCLACQDFTHYCPEEKQRLNAALDSDEGAC